jgi:hypothetical protein
MTKPEAAMPGDLLWGVPEIAAYIQRNHRTTYYLIGKGAVPVTKLGPRTIVARKSEIDRAFSEATNKASPRVEPKADIKKKPRVPKRRLRPRIVAHDART